ncbi:conserved Plasmodium protein, unknown function [Plasmodium knowlesi strain H]|uniref:Uncharacterized protein n=3 Tax=Plasmodium knowlesi TaxID=5850 RepID=A0A5K1U122_PLAKH|nr:conserved Plasmodium protein, unknown function [Plasmodium knowlesi strain H]OTN64613.1 Uncharacterized protein PKNOH_S130168000 [Plasmodium knowlesi]CAA9988848.1 conserved Plasmodium protein, unknown function [Plasmodium knowlesi strain H]SBO24675.1 conserved Plasmodium protein, unknown function [Plasmodium knowlesi strain H]SBO27957.1 conserved Plasmodium protein, unknown function [Plasmodium knowlesi strain H]VVS78322.1 conserved Plasmodium protein, unknown function [Plasmodium knowlesi |eukprot:XP_002261194.1 hypothetical protein, conserved in Plasmodium species [Plasmodium knowlesi strain H]
MKCVPFPCNSDYYYDALSNVVLSDDEQFEDLINKRCAKKNVHHNLEKKINQIIHDTKKNCDINSDFEQVEKLPNPNCESAYSDDDCLDDIDIILKKKKTKNMFSRVNKNDILGHITLPSKNTKQRIYSLREYSQEEKNVTGTINERNDNPQVDLPNEEIIEKLKNVLCNGLNKYIKDMLKEEKQDSPCKVTYKVNDCTNKNNSYYKTSDKNRDIFKEECANRCEAPRECNPNMRRENSLKSSNGKFLNRKNENTHGTKIHNTEQTFEVKTHGSDKPSRNPSSVIHNKKEYATPTSATKRNTNWRKKNCKHKCANRNKSKYTKNIYPSKRKKWTNENSLSLNKNKTFRWEGNIEMYDKRMNSPKGHLKRHSINSPIRISNSNAKLSALEQQHTYTTSKMNCTSDPIEDFVFSHFQKNANNDNLVGKFRF